MKRTARRAAAVMLRYHREDFVSYGVGAVLLVMVIVLKSVGL